MKPRSDSQEKKAIEKCLEKLEQALFNAGFKHGKTSSGKLFGIFKNLALEKKVEAIKQQISEAQSAVQYSKNNVAREKLDNIQKLINEPVPSFFSKFGKSNYLPCKNEMKQALFELNSRDMVFTPPTLKKS